MDETEALRNKRKQHAEQAATSLEETAVGAPVEASADAEKPAREGKGQAKRGSSRASRRAEKMERRVSKGLRRVSKAVNKGVAKYIKRRDASAAKRRDGALVDFYANMARGVSQTFAESSPAIVDVAKGLHTRRSRRYIRKTMKRLPRIPFLV